MWHSKSIHEVLREVNVDPNQGLSEEEVNVRLEIYGANKLQPKKKKNILVLFVTQLQDWLIYILFASVVTTLFLGQHTDAVIIISCNYY